MVQTTFRDYLQATEDAISSGDIDEAMTNCQHILSYFPESLEAQRLLGEIYLEQGHLEEAQQTFDWILTSDPENVLAYCNRALISERMLDFDTALDCYQQAYELSRGNRQIRQEFNQLSAKIGQPGFMFSRAGLARLYMRGDLLPQALLEWEAVLNASPDRLDARLGLLETYWREGFYEQAEQLATRILEDVPGCLKALLLIAYVTSFHDIHQATELIQRAEGLDPELVMAHELFSDLLASQPNDPFVALLKKGPVVLTEISDGKPASLSESHSTAANGSSSTPALSDAFTSWSSLDTLTEVPQAPQSYQPLEDFSAFAPLPGNRTQQADPWAFGQSVRSETQPDPWAPGQPIRGEPVPASESWQAGQDDGEDDVDAAIAHDQALLEQQPWYHADQSAEPVPAPVDAWNSVNDPAPLSSADSWSMTSSERGAESPAAPAWLDMLTKGERRQPSGAIPPLPVPPPIEQEPPVVTPPTQPPTQAQPAPATQAPLGQKPAATPIVSEEDEVAPFPFASDDGDVEDMGWPEWLKSLGAQAMEGRPQPEPVVPPPAQADAQPVPVDSSEAPAVQAESLPQPEQQQSSLDPWAFPAPLAESHPQVEQQPVPAGFWIAPAVQAEPIPEAEQQVIATMENLERDLYAQGFTPLEPGALSTLAQGATPTPAVPSALAQLGNFVEELANAGDTPLSAPALVSPDAPVSQPQPIEPLWPATPGPIFSPAPGSSVSVPPEPAIFSQARQNPAPTPVAEPRTNILPEPVMASTHRTEPLYEIELETTMKRPAIRLQPMQQQPIAQQVPLVSASKGRSGEHPATSKAVESHLSYRDRLLKGYHCQLAGSYDEAMQEYRIIIRNAPELLGEVISNLRALLKLAPKYTAGYRVLGDVYMRQGEYLQAMEAYNKALTMTKKAKGQSS